MIGEKMEIVLLFALLGLAVSQSNIPTIETPSEILGEDCRSYKCSDSEHTVKYPTCIILTNNTYYSDNTCNSDEVCEVGKVGKVGKVDENKDHKCQSSNSTITIYPGEECRSEADFCEGINYCTSHITCKGMIEGKPCVNPWDCNPGLYCHEHDPKNKTCTALVAEGQPCVKDVPCQLNSGCVKRLDKNSTSICTKLMSLPAGTNLSTSNDTKYCENQYALKAKGAKSYICTDSLKSRSDLPTPCNSTCVSTIDTITNETANSTCSCSFSAAPKKYCGLFHGDPIGMDYAKSYKKFLDNGAHKCNTHKPESPRCLEYSWDRDDYFDLMYYRMTFHHYTVIQDVESCTKEIFLPVYEMYKDKHDFGEWFAVPFLVLLTFLA